MRSASFARLPRSLMMSLLCLRRHLASTLHQRLELFACSVRSRYPVHRGAPSWRPVAKPNLVDLAYQASTHPNPFSSKPGTSPPRQGARSC